MLVDVNGYTVDYKLYTGKTNAASGKGLSFDVVTRLVKKDYLGSGYIVSCGNFYTSPLLFRHLSQQGFGACGTHRQGRVGVPTTQENALNKNQKEAPSGGYVTMSCSLSNGWTPGKCPRATLSILFTLRRLSCGGRRTMMGKVRGSPC